MRNARLTIAVLWLGLVGAAGCGHKPSAEDQKAVDDLHTIISLYIVAENHAGEPPASVDDVRKVFTEPASQKDVNLMDDGRYVVVWKTVADPGSKDAATTVLAFQKAAYTNGGIVQMVDGVDTPYMTADALKAALKQNPAWTPTLLEEKPAPSKP